MVLHRNGEHNIGKYTLSTFGVYFLMTFYFQFIHSMFASQTQSCIWSAPCWRSVNIVIKNISRNGFKTSTLICYFLLFKEQPLSGSIYHTSSNLNFTIHLCLNLSVTIKWTICLAIKWFCHFFISISLTTVDSNNISLPSHVSLNSLLWLKIHLIC